MVRKIWVCVPLFAVVVSIGAGVIGAARGGSLCVEVLMKQTAVCMTVAWYLEMVHVSKKEMLPWSEITLAIEVILSQKKDISYHIDDIFLNEQSLSDNDIVSDKVSLDMMISSWTSDLFTDGHRLE